MIKGNTEAMVLQLVYPVFGCICQREAVMPEPWDRQKHEHEQSSDDCTCNENRLHFMNEKRFKLQEHPCQTSSCDLHSCCLHFYYQIQGYKWTIYHLQSHSMMWRPTARAPGAGSLPGQRGHTVPSGVQALHIGTTQTVFMITMCWSVKVKSWIYRFRPAWAHAAS